VFEELNSSSVSFCKDSDFPNTHKENESFSCEKRNYGNPNLNVRANLNHDEGRRKREEIRS
jgi:hypothetical protein